MVVANRDHQCIEHPESGASPNKRGYGSVGDMRPRLYVLLSVSKCERLYDGQARCHTKGIVSICEIDHDHLRTCPPACSFTRLTYRSCSPLNTTLGATPIKRSCGTFSCHHGNWWVPCRKFARTAIFLRDNCSIDRSSSGVTANRCERSSMSVPIGLPP